jgi:hypothetical protein
MPLFLKVYGCTAISGNKARSRDYVSKLKMTGNQKLPKRWFSPKKTHRATRHLFLFWRPSECGGHGFNCAINFIMKFYILSIH